MTIKIVLLAMTIISITVIADITIAIMIIIDDSESAGAEDYGEDRIEKGDGDDYGDHNESDGNDRK